MPTTDEVIKLLASKGITLDEYDVLQIYEKNDKIAIYIDGTIYIEQKVKKFREKLR